MWTLWCPTTVMAEYLVLKSVRTVSVRALLKPTTTGLNIKRKACENAPASAPAGSIRTEADLTEITLSTMLYGMIFKGYYNRVHEMQV